MRTQQLPPKPVPPPVPTTGSPLSPAPLRAGKTTVFDSGFNLAGVIQLQDALWQLDQFKKDLAAMAEELAGSRRQLAQAKDRIGELTELHDRTGEIVRTLRARNEHLSAVREELTKDHDQLAREHRQLGDFTRAIVQKLKAPLRGINSLTRWIAEDCAERLDEPGRDQLDLVRACAIKLQPLITSIEQYPNAAPTRNRHAD